VLKTFAGGQLFGARFGAAPPWVLALPGWQRSHRDFDELLAGLDAVALDLPGFGAAPAPPEAWTTEQYAGHVAAVLDEMAPKVVVVGHSFGGRVATHLAAIRPDRVAGLVLTGVPGLVAPKAGGSGRKAPLSLRVAKSLRRRGLINDARVERLRHKHGSADYRAARGVMRDVLVKAVNENYEAPLAAFGGPVELIWGSEDDQAPVATAVAAAAQGGASTHLLVLPGVGHFVTRDRPDALVASLVRLRP
jgi:pimeloyl-ACP methyl ester carboxylesterase